ncbi:lantibiotic dehydratase [Streptomyces sp. TLI_171]|uniref:lantibiotic dehydratase n=1 Tax=Streptomyces sp. TLI_171 TaxID=1938859 RepID=UPI000FEF05E9|nr:lantibiotic dehydratase [Streptomyces sp. TLI_171]RKE17127.1 lantibiotic biosynthesis dehydratase-like protein [Streptomyces sp. TLI_171]
MSHPAQDRPAPDRPAPDRPAQDLPAQDLPAGAGPVPAALAPYALVRSTVLARSAQPAETATVRAALDELRRIEAESEQLRAALGDDLYASRDGHGEEFHRRVVLPLRRDLHNGRPPRPLPPDRLGDLPERLPRLARWLRLGDRRTELLAALATGVPPALAAERAALAAICRDPAFARAVATTSADLLRAVTANGHHPDGAGARSGRRRKEEATVLRHALRATCKTSPLSWFTAVGWVSGEPAPDDAGGPADGPAGATLRELPGAAAQPGDVHRAPISVVRVNRALVGALVVALLDRPRRRLSLPHAMTSAAVIDGGQARYARTRTVFAGGRYLVGREEQLDLAARPELALVASLVEYPELPGPLGTRLAAALGRPVGDPGVQRFLGQLLDAELLVPVEPVHPQHPEPLAALAVWLEQWPQDAELIRRIRRIDAATKAFAATPAADRPRALAELAGDWRHLLADAGRPVPADAAPLTVLSEDVHETPSSGAARFGGSGDRPGETVPHRWRCPAGSERRTGGRWLRVMSRHLQCPAQAFRRRSGLASGGWWRESGLCRGRGSVEWVGRWLWVMPRHRRGPGRAFRGRCRRVARRWAGCWGLVIGRCWLNWGRWPSCSTMGT